jgi:hypothetical protein
MHPAHAFPSYFSKIHSSITLLCMPRSSEWSLPFSFPTKIMHVLLISPNAYYIPAYVILMDLITLIICDEEYKLRSFSLCSLLQSITTPPLLGPNILTTSFSNTLNVCFSLSVRDQVPHSYKTGKITVLHI